KRPNGNAAADPRRPRAPRPPGSDMEHRGTGPGGLSPLMSRVGATRGVRRPGLLRGGPAEYRRAVMTFAHSVPATLLVTVTGRDRPGISARLLSTLSVFPVTVADLEQVVIGGRLLLGALLSVDERVAPGVRRERLFEEIRSAVSKVAVDLDMVVDFTVDGERVRPSGNRLDVTIMADPLRPGAVGAIASCVARAGANIDRIERLASYPVTALSLSLAGADL